MWEQVPWILIEISDRKGDELPGTVSKLKGGVKVSSTLLGVCFSVAGFCFIVLSS